MANDEPVRIAMWSGPRNISTAMMRSWGNRPDTFVCDEPFYAYYLLQTGVPHPGADEVIRSQENDWRKVVAWLTGDKTGSAGRTATAWAAAGTPSTRPNSTTRALTLGRRRAARRPCATAP